MSQAYPAEFRQRAVELARQGAQPVARIAADLGIAHEHHHGPAARERVVEGAAQPFQFPLAAGEHPARETVEGVRARVGMRGRARLGVHALKRGEHLGRRRGPLCGDLRQQPQDQVLEVGRAVLAVPGRRDRRRVDVLRDHRRRVVGLERRLPRHELVEHRAERIEVRLRGDRAAERLLGRHVRDGPDCSLERSPCTPLDASEFNLAGERCGHYSRRTGPISRAAELASLSASIAASESGIVTASRKQRHSGTSIQELP